MPTGLENLWVYALAEELEIEVHKLTKGFPRDELYRSVDQLRRSSSATANNIAESYHKTTMREKTRFIDIAKGEAEETKRNLIKSYKKALVSELKAAPLAEQYTILLKGLSAYSKFLAFSKPKLKTG
ncbi:MAG: four helix bundle protein [Parcubacteria group bacterium]|nr:four helix bundle protein [Parcubacteria group bacterium]